MVFAVTGLDDDIEQISVSFDDGATSQAVTLDAQGRFTADLSGRTGRDGRADGGRRRRQRGQQGHRADARRRRDGGEVVIDATQFHRAQRAHGQRGDGDPADRRPLDHETNAGNDANGERAQRRLRRRGYLDPNGGPEDKASFVVDAAAAGTYQLTFRMAANSERPIAIHTGDQSVAITGTNTGTFTNWTDFPVTLTLQQGANTVVITQTGGARPQHRQRHRDAAGGGGRHRRRGR